MLYEKPLVIDFGSITEHTFTGGHHPSPADGDGDDDDGDDDGDD